MRADLDRRLGDHAALHARTFYLTALIRLRPPSLRAYLDEATDDCEGAVRTIARAHLEQPA